MTNDEGDGSGAPPAAAPLDAPAPAEPALEALPVPAVTASSTDDLREAVGVARLDEKAARKAEKEAAKAAGREQVRLQKEAKAKAKAEAEAAKRAERGEDPDADADPDDELDADGRPRKRGKLLLVLALSVVAGGVIASFVLLGRSNAERFLFTCTPSKILAQQGRSFPPWGASGLSGAEWKPIPIPPNAECESRETSDHDELVGWYLTALEEQAEEKLKGSDVTEVDEAQRELEQALLLARDPDRREQRKSIERLLGDVEFWRGAARVKDAAETLDEAAKRFDEANTAQPRHASGTAAWAELARSTAEALRAGPGGVKLDTIAGPGVDGPNPDVPTGVALPVEDPPTMTMPDAAPAAPPIDAGLPQGGVLL